MGHKLFSLAPALLLGAACALSGSDSRADSANPKRQDLGKKVSITFPTFLPGSRIVVGEDLVKEANALASKDEQIKFLLKILPPTNQGDKILTDRQLYAIRLLSLTDSDDVIDSLLDRLDFMHKGDGWPASHALGRLGERSVEPIVKKLAAETDRQRAIILGNALIEIKKKQYPKFLEELRKRKDVNVSDAVLNELLETYQFAPD